MSWPSGPDICRVEHKGMKQKIKATKAKYTQHVYQTSNGYVKISEHEIWYKMLSSHELHGFHIFMQMKCCLGTLSASVQAAPQ